MPRFPNDVVDRSLKWSRRVLKMALSIPGRPGLNRLLDPVSASASSVAANAKEAQGSFSRADSFSSMNIARKEARESWVRPRLLAESGIGPPRRFAWLIKEADELVAILASICKKRHS